MANTTHAIISDVPPMGATMPKNRGAPNVIA
jgi:hypothetical protein